MKGIVKNYIKTLKKGLNTEHISLLRNYEEEYSDKRNVDGYVYLISREFIGQTKTITLNEEQEQARFKLAQLKLCNLKYIEEYTNNFKAIFYKCEDDSLKDEYFRKIPIIGEFILQSYREWKGKYDGIQYLKDNTLGERINFTQDYVARKRRSDKECKLIESAFSKISLKDQRDGEIPVQWGCSEHKHRKDKSKHKRFKNRKDADFFPYKRKKKKYKFRKSKTFGSPEKRIKKLKQRRYWKKNTSSNKKVPNYRKELTPNSNNKKCWTCGETGHFAPDCPKKDKKISRINMVELMLYYADSCDLDILYNLHFHKTCFLAVLQDNRGQHAMKIVLDALGQYWKDVEEHRLLQYLQQKTLAELTSQETPNLGDNSDLEASEFVPLAQDEHTIDKKQKSIVINNSIEVQMHQNKGDLLFTKLQIANLGGKTIEALVDTGASTSFIKKGVIPDSYMITLDKPVFGCGANANMFSLKRQTQSLLIKIQDSLHKIRFLEIENISNIEIVHGKYKKNPYQFPFLSM
eukprot:TRINITY_DN9558_c0_g1_i1.p1 TRINITY_DN9558_c0_g1~~TRINITY_DN9558_c0_g1_i1.p1  ORF type:complete len:519 (-),score=49.72 TRINITY_DN9558_c0_g1_i1:3065-4621(-)